MLHGLGVVFHNVRLQVFYLNNVRYGGISNLNAMYKKEYVESDDEKTASQIDNILPPLSCNNYGKKVNVSRAQHKAPKNYVVPAVCI